LIEGTRRNPPPFPRPAILKKRTLTNLYNEHPAWLDNAHRDLGAASDWSGLPLLEDRAELRGLREAVTSAAAKGAISSKQADALVRVVNTVMGML
jgi:hypothetical protein